MNETTIWHALARDPVYCFPIYFSFRLRAAKTIQWSACQRVPTADTGPILWPVGMAMTAQQHTVAPRAVGCPKTGIAERSIHLAARCLGLYQPPLKPTLGRMVPVMPAQLGIHDFGRIGPQGVDGRNKPGHDDERTPMGHSQGPLVLDVAEG
jgi:hypothetical protein